jgi:hypothetical protein
MNVTLEQSVHIYARASRRWFGTKAYQKTQERIEQLAKIGDAEGAKVFELVKQHIAHLDTQRATDLPAPNDSRQP